MAAPGPHTPVRQKVKTEGSLHLSQPQGFYMKKKKSHEVEEMAPRVAALATECRAHQVLDLGSGKGYLSEEIASRYGLTVIGLEGSQSHTEEAKKRMKKLHTKFHKKTSRSPAHGGQDKDGIENPVAPVSSRNTTAATVDDSSNPFSTEGKLDCTADANDLSHVESSVTPCSFNLTDDLSTDLLWQEQSSLVRCSSLVQNLQSDVLYPSKCPPSPSPTQKESVSIENLPSQIHLAGTEVHSSLPPSDQECDLHLKLSCCDQNQHDCNKVQHSVSYLKSEKDKSGTKLHLEVEQKVFHDRSSSVDLDLSSSKLTSKQKPSVKSSLNEFDDYETVQAVSVLDSSEGVSCGPTYTPVTMHLSLDTNGERMLEEVAEQSNGVFKRESPSVLIGLHACGDLTCCALRLFASTGTLTGLCIVGCCYNHISEGTEPRSGFPMSRFLCQRGCSLGTNTRMLANQSPERLASEELNHGCLSYGMESMYYRAVLQVILSKEFGVPTDSRDICVGKVYRKCKKRGGFVYYVHKCLEKLSIRNTLSDDQIISYLKQYEVHKKEMFAFHQIRGCIAPCTESLIVLDRLLYLREMGFDESSIAPLFDAMTSPRHFAIVAKKLKSTKTS